MPESKSRSARFRGRLPPTHGDDWAVSTVALRATNREETAECAVTGTDVALNEHHYYVTVVRETDAPTRPDESDHLVVADGALGELDAWLDEN